MLFKHMGLNIKINIYRGNKHNLSNLFCQPTPVQQQGYFQHTPVQPQQYFQQPLQQPYQAPVVPNPSVQPQGYYQPTHDQNSHGYYNQPQVQNQPIFQQPPVPNLPV